MERTTKGEQKKKSTGRKRKEEVEEVEEEKELLKRSWRKRRTKMCAINQNTRSEKIVNINLTCMCLYCTCLIFNARCCSW